MALQSFISVNLFPFKSKLEMPLCVLTSCSARKELPKRGVFISSPQSVGEDTAVSRALGACLHLHGARSFRKGTHLQMFPLAFQTVTLAGTMVHLCPKVQSPEEVIML